MVPLSRPTELALRALLATICCWWDCVMLSSGKMTGEHMSEAGVGVWPSSDDCEKLELIDGGGGVPEKLKAAAPALKLIGSGLVKLRV